MNPRRRKDKSVPKRDNVRLALHVKKTDGVDVTLIRWMLAKSPRERLLTAQAAAQAIVRARLARGLEPFGSQSDFIIGESDPIEG